MDHRYRSGSDYYIIVQCCVNNCRTHDTTQENRNVVMQVALDKSSQRFYLTVKLGYFTDG